MASRIQRPMTVAEEIAHSLTHGFGFLLGLAGLVMLLGVASTEGTHEHVLSAVLYGSTIVVLYASSTLFHALPRGRAKRIAQSMDHAAIFLLIAGTYTPITLLTLDGPLGYALFGLEWTLAAIGMVHEVLRGHGGRKLQLILYLVMGWAVLFALGPLSKALPAAGLALLIGGGVAYSVGVIFYLRQQRRWNHTIWHLFVLVGSICHFLAVYWYVMPV